MLASSGEVSAAASPASAACAVAVEKSHESGGAGCGWDGGGAAGPRAGYSAKLPSVP